MNTSISFAARKEIERNQLPQLLHKYKNSKTYEILENNDENGFVVREARSTYVTRIITGIALTAFSLGIAYFTSESVRDLFKERKIKQFTCKAESEKKSENDLQLSSRLKAEDMLIVQVEERIQLEEVVEPLVETVVEEIIALEEAPLEVPAVVSKPEPLEIQPEVKDEVPVEAEKKVEIVQVDVIVQPEPSSSQSEEEESDPPPPVGKAPPLPCSNEEEPPFPSRVAPAIPAPVKRAALPLPRSHMQVGTTIFEEREVLLSPSEKKLQALCSELKEKSLTNLIDQKFTLDALIRERKSSILGTELLDKMISSLTSLVEASEALSQTFNKAKSASDIANVYLSDAFSCYSAATNAFMAYYQAAERKCKKDAIYVRSHRDEIQSTFQLMVKHRQFAEELRSLNVVKAAEAFQQVQKYTLSMNEALTAANHVRPKEESLFDRMEVFFEKVVK